MLFKGPIATPRLELRPLIEADAAALRAITDDPAVIAAISFLRAPFTLTDARTLIAMNRGDNDLFRGCWHPADSVLVGVIGAHRTERGDIEIGYWIGTRYQGQGYAGEAARAVLDRLGTDHPTVRIFAECHPDNRASWHILERLGFRATGEAGKRPGRLRLNLVDKSGF